MSHRRQSFSCIKFAASAVRAHWQRSMSRLQRPFTGDIAAIHPARSSQLRCGNSRTTFSSNSRTRSRTRNDWNSNSVPVLHRSRNGCETVAAGTRALASRHGSKDHLRVNSFSRRRGRRIPRRYTSASRREESSRAHLSKSCSASKSTIAVCGRDTNRQAAVHGGLLRSAQNRHRLS